MKKWIYRYLMLDTIYATPLQVEDWLNKLGEEGWECVYLYTVEYHIGYFKREKQ